MRFIKPLLSSAALLAAFSVPALAQQAPTVAPQEPVLLVVPGGAQAGQPTPQVAPDQGRVIILAPQGEQAAQPAQGGTAAAAAPTFDFERFARELTERAYLQGRLDERNAAQRAGIVQLSPAELQRLAAQLFERGYLQGRLEGQVGQAAQGAQQPAAQGNQQPTILVMPAPAGAPPAQ